nr:MAG TPA: hypothetical protein [Caudoviricetes sp.]
MLNDRGEARCRGSPRGTGREAAPQSVRGGGIAHICLLSSVFPKGRRLATPRKNARLWNAARRILPSITYDP